MGVGHDFFVDLLFDLKNVERYFISVITKGGEKLWCL